MRTDVVMPQMGESVAEGTVTVWLKEIGDFIERDEPLFEITTDKVDAEVPSPVEGTLVEKLVEPGQTVEINTVVAIIDTSGDAAKAQTPPQESAPAGDHTQTSRPQQNKAVQVTASPEGAISPETPREPWNGPSRETDGSVQTSMLRSADASATAEELRQARSTPLVRRIAREHGISNLAQIQGTGLSGRVTKDDILSFIDAGMGATASPLAPGSPSADFQATTDSGASVQRPYQPPSTSTAFGYGARENGHVARQQHLEMPRPSRDSHLPPIELGPRDRSEPMTPQRLSIARHMTASRATSAHAHTVHEIDFTQVALARKEHAAEFESRGAKLTYTAFIVRALAEALAAYPVVNASLDQDQIIYRGDIHIGVAVALPKSLIVPVVRNVDELSLMGIARSINDLAERARNKQLKPGEVKGGTFTLSNHGIFGPEFGIPVINQPQTAIVSTGAIKKRVVVDQKTDAIMVRPTSIFCLSFDHRLIDGATADRFMAKTRQILENWEV